jgi:hypothetical protein
MLRIAKECHQDFNLLHTMILVIHHFFGQKWLTHSVLSPQGKKSIIIPNFESTIDVN